MARKTAAELREALEAAEALELEATEGLSNSVEGLTAAQEAFPVDEDGNIGGTPEDLEVLQGAFSAYVKSIKSNWKYRGLPTMTEERRAKAIEATNKSKAKRLAREKAEAKAAAAG